jgi:hypothetical protein
MNWVIGAAALRLSPKEKTPVVVLGILHIHVVKESTSSPTLRRCSIVCAAVMSGATEIYRYLSPSVSRVLEQRTGLICHPLHQPQQTFVARRQLRQEIGGPSGAISSTSATFSGKY